MREEIASFVAKDEFEVVEMPEVAEVDGDVVPDTGRGDETTRIEVAPAMTTRAVTIAATMILETV